MLHFFFLRFTSDNVLLCSPASRFRLHMRWWLLWTVVHWQVERFKWAARCCCCCPVLLLPHPFLRMNCKTPHIFHVIVWWCSSPSVCSSACGFEFWVKQVTLLRSDPLAFQVVPHIWYMFWCRAWVNCVTGIVNFRHIFQGFDERSRVWSGVECGLRGVLHWNC